MMDFSNIVINVSKEGAEFTCEELVELWHSVGWLTGSAEYPDRLRDCLKRNIVVYARDSGKLVGLCAAMSDGFNVFINYMVVLKDYQNNGIGGSLLDEMIKLNPEHRIHVNTRNASKFYRSHGFIDGNGFYLKNPTYAG